MSETQITLRTANKAAPNGVAAAINACADHKSVQASKDFIAAARALIADPGVQYVSEMHDRIDRLEKELEERDKALQQKAADNEGCLRSFHDDHARHARELAERDDTIESLHLAVDGFQRDIANLSSARDQLLAKCQRVEGSLAAEKAAVRGAEQRASSLEEQISKQLDEIEAHRRDLQKLESHKSTLEVSLKRRKKECAEVTKDLQETAKELKALEDFGTDLHEETVEQTLDRVLTKDKVPRSNSRTAKVMRISAALHILARLVDVYIFQPTYLLTANSGMREILLECAITEPSRESFLRSMLLAFSGDDEEREAAERVDIVTEEMMAYIHDLIAVGRRQEFCMELRQIVGEIQTKWDHVRRLERVVQLTFDPAFPMDFQCESVELWLSRPDGGELGDQVDRLERDEVQRVVLPGMATIEEGEVRQIMPGVALTTAQASSAKEEAAREGTDAAPRTELSRLRATLNPRQPMLFPGGRTRRSISVENSPFLDYSHS
ncbi:hypothetical protein MPH_12840 [Macrophomina phaseolina MS6]|uniref:Uncharacterized protein n=1 Tax=Macrophomina phaseolina (strain MS6) TaxID=1126212 RepID=K2S075_MACPH|nr:hypothetical protein MPH_12840 [Macrophomina phaseolina MS6]